MQSREYFNERLGADACRSFKVSPESDGTVTALLFMTVELLQKSAESQPDGRAWLEAKRLKLFDDLSRIYSAEEQQDELAHALDTMDLATGSAWGRLGLETNALPPGLESAE